MAAEIVNEFAAEFSLDELDQTKEINSLPKLKPSDIVQVFSENISSFYRI